LPVQPGRITRHICVEGWVAILMSGAAFAQDAMHKDAMGK
jgi:pentapeptide MXKDX repeat protein